MLCKKCGKKLKPDEEFCSVCGYYNDPNDEAFSEEDDKSFDDDYFDEIRDADDDDDENVGHDEIDDMVESNLINGVNVPDNEELMEFTPTSEADPKQKLTNFKDDRLVEAFTGEDYKWIIRRPFNLYAFFLSWIYFLYRKMYITGLIGLVITGIVYKFFPSFVIPYAIIVMVLSGFLFNPLYKLYASIRIRSIRKHNYGSDDFTIEQICQQKGGTSLILTLVIFFIFLVVMIRTYYSFSFNNENTKFWSENSENKANCTSMSKSSYRMLNEEEAAGVLEEAVCNVRRTNSTKSYDIYLKITNPETNTFRIVFFRDDKDSVTIEGVGVNLELLQDKNRNGIISEEETQLLNRTLEIRNQYTKIHDASIDEDRLIKTKKNKSEKINYIIPKDEILR